MKNLDNIILITLSVIVCGVILYLSLEDWKNEQAVNEARRIIYTQGGWYMKILNNKKDNNIDEWLIAVEAANIVANIKLWTIRLIKIILWLISAVIVFWFLITEGNHR